MLCYRKGTLVSLLVIGIELMHVGDLLHEIARYQCYPIIWLAGYVQVLMTSYIMAHAGNVYCTTHDPI